MDCAQHETDDAGLDAFIRSRVATLRSNNLIGGTDPPINFLAPEEALAPFQDPPRDTSAATYWGTWRLSLGKHDANTSEDLFCAALSSAHQRPDSRLAVLHEALLQRTRSAPGAACCLEPSDVVGREVEAARLGGSAGAGFSALEVCGWCQQLAQCSAGNWRGQDVTYCAACWQGCEDWVFRDVRSLVGVMPSETPGVEPSRFIAIQPTGFVAVSCFQEGKRPVSSSNVAMVYVVGPHAADNRLSRQEFLGSMAAIGEAIDTALASFNAKCQPPACVQSCRVCLPGAGPHNHPSTSKVDNASALLLGLLGRRDRTHSPRYALAFDGDAFRLAWERIQKPLPPHAQRQLLLNHVAEPLPCHKVRFLHHTAPATWSEIAAVLAAARSNAIGTSVEELVSLVVRVRTLACLASAPGEVFALRAAAEKLWPCIADGIDGSFKGVVRFLVDIVGALPGLFPLGLLVLRRGDKRTVLLSRRQCAALVAAGFFGVVPKQDSGPRGEWESLPSYDVSQFLAGEDNIPQMMCIFNYFQQLASAPVAFLDQEFVSFSRRMVPPTLQADTGGFWGGEEAQTCPLLDFVVIPGGQIEAADGALQADFANQFIGGGVLAGGLAQEEIRFLASPECIPGCLFVERMRPDEAVMIVGALQYSSYSGYWNDFEFRGLGPRELCARPLDGKRRRDVHLVAFDALSWTRRVRADQYSAPYVRRELLKAYAACLGDPDDTAGTPRPLATGNWGCGAFKGDPQLKALVQWLAASRAGRAIQYYPYGDERVKPLADVVARIQGKGTSCAQLYALICDCPAPSGSRCLFDEVLLRLQRGP